MLQTSLLNIKVPLVIQRGFKEWLRCDATTGFCHQVEVYLGKGANEDANDGGLGYNVVRRLTKSLRRKRHHVYFDNLFTSVCVFKGTS